MRNVETLVMQTLWVLMEGICKDYAKHYSVIRDHQNKLGAKLIAGTAELKKDLEEAREIIDALYRDAIDED